MANPMHSQSHITHLRSLGFKLKLRRKKPIMNITLSQEDLTQAVVNFIESTGMELDCFTLGDISFTQGRGPTGTTASIELTQGTSIPMSEALEELETATIVYKGIPPVELTSAQEEEAHLLAREVAAEKVLEEVPAPEAEKVEANVIDMSEDVDPASTAAILANEDEVAEAQEAIKVADEEIADGASVFDAEPTDTIVTASSDVKHEEAPASSGVVSFI